MVQCEGIVSLAMPCFQFISGILILTDNTVRLPLQKSLDHFVVIYWKLTNAVRSEEVLNVSRLGSESECLYVR